MKKVDFKGTEYEFPENWNEIKYKQYKEYQDLAKLELSKIERTGRIVSLFTGIPYEVISNAEYIDFINLVNDCNAEFLNKLPVNTNIVKEVKIKGIEYKVHSFDNSKFKEFALFEKFDSDFAESVAEGIPYKLAVMLRIEGEDIDDLDIDERVKLFEEELDTETVLGIAGFFLQKQKKSELTTLHYTRLLKLQMMLKQGLKKLITENTVGSLKLSFLQKLYIKLLIKFLI